MNILYLVPDVNSEGGIQNFAKDQFRSLQNTNNITLADWQNSLKGYELAGLRLMPESLAAAVYTSLGAKRGKHSYDKYDIVHYWHIDAALGDIKRMPRNAIICCYGLEVLLQSAKGYRKKLYQEAFACSAAIITCSVFTKDYIAEHYGVPQDKIISINPGIELDRFTVRPKPSKNIVIGTLSRFVKRKNVPNVITALKVLRDQHGVDFTYYLAGDGPEKEAILAALKEAGIKHQYFGKISEEDKVSVFYPALDVFVMPPLETPDDVEGFGIVYLEANACGVPVVASKTGGVTDAVKPEVSGLFADPENPEDIAQKIQDILTSSLNYRQTTRQWAANFTQQKTAGQFQAVYENILKQR